MPRKLLVIDVAALGYDFLRAGGPCKIAGIACQPARSVFPALTCPVQASFRTASPPSRHGMIANGLYFRDLHRPMFWEQSAGLVGGERIWSEFRRRGGTVGLLFWQQSLGEQVDMILSPAPIHKHHGGMIQDCYSQPAGLYRRLCDTVGGPFKLRHYWGPMASPKVGDWVSAATAAVVQAKAAPAPDLLMVYLPTLDYDLQRHEPAHAKNVAALAAVRRQLELMISAARTREYEVMLFGDYAIAPVQAGNAAVYPNRALASAGLMATRRIGDMLYPDFHASQAFAMVDHEVAHVYVRDEADIAAVRSALESLDGIAEILDRPAQQAAGIDHANSGELVLVASPSRWLAYPWWTDPGQAPDYAAHIDIHNKPGYDPCELFSGPLFVNISQDASNVRGTHGRVGAGREIAWGSTLGLKNVTSVLDLAGAVRDWLTKRND